MAISTGARLGPYEIQSALGAGGMGEVYKARDTRLDRTVAIKILPDALAADSQFRDRFDREARTISQLDHPHICALHDVGEQDGTAYLVMQYLEGETLADRLTKGALPLDQALQVAIQIADALAAAHKAGIVHRDLKPGNIMLTKAGAKLLDFGLAKTAAAGGTHLSMQPTTPPITQQGAILGTFQYMAPEQLEGHEADARTDIFAFGAVVYEMLTGRKAFEGKSQASLIGAIMHAEPPPVSGVSPLAPRALDRIVRKCLAKDPDVRWQTAHDLRDELQWIRDAHAPGPSPTSSRSLRWIGPLVASVLLLMIIAAGAGAYLRHPAVDTRVYRNTFVPPAALGGLYALALSPDGHLLAFVARGSTGRTGLWVRPLDSLSAQPLMGTEGAAVPFWSPDSRSLGFVANGKLKRIEAAGGPVLTLADAYPSPGSWNRDDVILFTGPFVLGGEAPILRVASTGGIPTPVTTVDRSIGEALHQYPWFLPDGRHFLFTTLTATEANNADTVGPGSVYVGSLDSRGRTRLFQSVTNARYVRGELFFVRGTALMTQAFDLAGFKPSGEPALLVEQVRTLSSAQPVGAYTVTDTGVLAFQAGEDKSRLTWFDRGGKEEAVFAGRDRSEGLIGKSYPDLSLSPDGHRATVVLAGPDTRPDIWIFDLVRGVRTRLTFDPAGASAPVWSPDGRAVIFKSLRNGQQDFYTKPSSGAGSETSILSDRDGKFPESLSPDARYLLYYRSGAAPNLWVLPLFGDRKPFPFTKGQPNARSQFNERRSQFSPDGRWVAYQSTESGLGRWDVYVVPFPGPGPKVQISTAGGREPRWRHDGRELFYLADNTLMAAGVVSDGDRFDVRDAKPLFEVRPPPRAANEAYDVSPDGQHFFFNVIDESIDPVTVVVNWPALLKK